MNSKKFPDQGLDKKLDSSHQDGDARSYHALESYIQAAPPGAQDGISGMGI